MEKFDAIVIGAGQAGPSLATGLAGKGNKVAMIERKWFGGTCVNNGCTPTKTLVASARIAHLARRSSDYGVNIGGPITVDMAAVKARKDKIVDKSKTGVENWLRGTEGLEVIVGHAQFTSNNTLMVGDRQLQAAKIFINVGGRARRFDQGSSYFTNSDMMEIDYLPEHLVVVGGSYIGLEFAQMYRRFGSEVTVIERNSRIIPREDPQVSEEVKKVLEQEGVKFRLNATCIEAHSETRGISVSVDCQQGPPEVQGSHLLMAIGREPNTHDLGLENTDIELDARGYIKVDECLRTEVEGVWAMGDVNGTGAFTHTAYNDYEIVWDQLYGERRRSIKDRVSCYALYTDPPLARVGLSTEQALDKKGQVLVGYRPFSKISRAREMGEDQGFMSVVIDPETEKILGCTIFGIGGDEIIHSVLDIMYADKTYHTIKEAVHIHPTVSELIPTMLGGLRLETR